MAIAQLGAKIASTITRTPRTSSGSSGASSAAGRVGSAIGQAVAPSNWSTSTRAQLVSGGSCPSGSDDIGGGMCRWRHNGATFAKGSSGSTAYSSGGGGGSSSGGGSGGGGRSGGGGGGGGGGSAGGVSPTAPSGVGEWLQAAGQIFARDPQAMLAVQLQDEYGDSGGNALYGMLTPYADYANALYLMQRGTDAAHGSVDDGLQWMEDYWQALRTPGARIDTQTALENLFNPPADSPLHAYLNSGDPTQQGNRALQLAAGAVETGMNPLVATAIMDQLRLHRDRYLGDAARGRATGSFVDYLRAAGIDTGRLMGVS